MKMTGTFLAAAIKTAANVIVTNNLKDFPEAYLGSFGLKVKTTDDFLTDVIDLNHDHALAAAFKEIVFHKKNPPLDEYQGLDQLRKIDLKDAADYLHALI